MVTIMPAAPLDGLAVLPEALVDQYIKPGRDQAALLSAFRLTALDWVERHTKRSLARRQWVAMFDGFDDVLRLPCEPVRDVASVSYVNATGLPTSGTGIWRLSGAHIVRAFGSQWPVTADRAAAVTVTFDAGYDDVGTEAPALQIAALMLMKHLFDGGSIDDVPATVTMLIDAQYRTPVIG